MPNYCDNSLILKGKQENLETLLTTYFKTNTDGELYLDLDLIETEMKACINTRFFILDSSPRITDNELMLEATTAWQPALNEFDYLCSEYKLDMEYSYCETGAGLAGRFIKDKVEGDSDEVFDYATLEYWQALFKFNGRIEYLEDFREEEYLNIFTPEVREKLELDKEFYPQNKVL